MDLVDFDEQRYTEIVAETTAFAAKLEVTDLTFIPISALHGDNVVDRSPSMPWYQGPPLLWHLEHVHIASDRNLIDVRFPVQWVIRPQSDRYHDYRGYAGRVASGVLRPGDDVVVLPSGLRTTIARVETADGELAEAYPPMSVVVHLTDDLDVGRGDLLARVANQPAVGQDLTALVTWMSGDVTLTPRSMWALKHTTKTVRAMATSLEYRLDVNTLHRDDAATGLTMNEIGRVRLRTTAPLSWDPYARNRATGSFVLIDEASNATVGAGTLLDR